MADSIVVGFLVGNHFVFFDCYFEDLRGVGLMRDSAGYRDVDFFVLVVSQRRVSDFQMTCLYLFLLFAVVDIFRVVLSIVYYLLVRNVDFVSSAFTGCFYDSGCKVSVILWLW